MNLTIDPWIPALRADGRRDLFSLQDLFAQAHELRDLAVKPHERIALMRLLLCITQAALDGPADEGEWEACQPLIQPRVRDYLAKWKAAFELFGEGQRFLQLSESATRARSPAKAAPQPNSISLSPPATTPHCSTIQRETTARYVRRAPPANLVTFQCFSPGGRIGVAKWNGKETPGKGSSNHAPCTPSSMIHTFILGDKLLATIHRNLLTKETVLDDYGADRWGKPVWESVVEKPETSQPLKTPLSLTSGGWSRLSRAIRLHESGESVLIANGLDYPIFPAFREATATIVKRKDELAVLPSSTRAASGGSWRPYPSNGAPARMRPAARWR